MSDQIEPPITEAAPAPEIFVEGFTCTSWNNGVIKLPFFSIAHTENGAAPERRVVARLAMPLASLVGIHDALGKVIGMLKEQGIIVEQVQH